jgi:ubiquinone/menaquinone biosynthesis C-methylase UbiE
MPNPLEGTAWNEAGTVAGFVQSPPNQTLIRVARAEISAHNTRLLDIGCGAGRNAVPLAKQGWTVTGVDLSWPMLYAASARAHLELPDRALGLVHAPMEQLPIRSGSMDLVVAHGIWNLARSSAEFRTAIREAARVSRRGALLFVFTFSRTTLAEDAAPVAGEEFVFTQFSGTPQCFLTSEQLIDELHKEGFAPNPLAPFTEHNRRSSGARRIGGPPVIYEGTFRYEP